MTLPDVMRAVRLTGHGGTDKLDYREDVPVPRPGHGEVVIAVTACGVNNTDVNTRIGWYSKSVTSGTDEAPSEVAEDGSWGGGLIFPRIQGADPAGQIAAVGEGVDAKRIGQRVIVDAWLRDPGGDLAKARYLGSESDGGFADYVAVPAINAHAIDSTFTDIELASFPCSYATAEHMLHRADVRPDQWVLVTGASGGVGGALIQLARRRGAKVIAVTSSSKREAVIATGADVVVDKELDALSEAVLDVSSGGVHVFADVVGGGGFAVLFEAIRPGGHYTTAGAIAGPIVPLDLRTLYLNDITMHGATVLPPAVFTNLVGYIERGEIQPIVAGTYPLAELVAAQEQFSRKEHIGAFVIEVAG